MLVTRNAHPQPMHGVHVAELDGGLEVGLRPLEILPDSSCSPHEQRADLASCCCVPPLRGSRIPASRQRIRDSLLGAKVQGKFLAPRLAPRCAQQQQEDLTI